MQNKSKSKNKINTTEHNQTNKIKKKLSEKLRINRILSIIVLIFGILLLSYMIVVESEPGAMPLLLIIIGSIWFTINQIKIKKYLQKK